MADSHRDAEWVLAAAQVTPAQQPLVGNKALNLVELREQTGAVPPWYVVTTQAWECALAAAGLHDRFAARLADLSDENVTAVAADLCAWTLALPLPQDLMTAILTHHETVIGATGWAALRASWVAEEPPPPPGRLAARRRPLAALEGLRHGWALAWTPDYLLARRRRGLPPLPAVPAIIVQRLGATFSSGTVWTANPSTGNPQELVLRARFGLAPVTDEPPDQADTYIVAKRTMEVQATLGRKQRQWLCDDERDGALCAEPIPLALQDDSSLRVEDVQHLARLGVLLEQQLGRPLRFNFAVDAQGERVVLRSRPLPAVEEYGPAAGPILHWDAAPLRQRAPGLTTPLAFSRLRREAALAAAAVLDLLAVPANPAPHPTGDWLRLLGLLRGRAFCHLKHWQELAHRTPAGSLAPALLAVALELPAPPELPPDHDGSGAPLPDTAARLRWRLRRWQLAQQRRHAEQVLQRYAGTVAAHLEQTAEAVLAPLCVQAVLSHYVALERLLAGPLLPQYQALADGRPPPPELSEPRRRLRQRQDALLAALGHHLAGEGLLANGSELAYLTVDELLDFADGSAVSTDLRGLVALRRAEFDRYRFQPDLAPAERCETYGMVYHRNRYRPPPTPADGLA